MSPYRVSILHDPALTYPGNAPYHAAQSHPELPQPGGRDPANRIHDAVRESFRMLGLDAGRFGTPDWNPLGGIVRPGDTVFLKPNMIAHRHRLRDEWDSVITHGSVIRAVADYVCRALEGDGRVWIGDAPQSDSNWDLLIERMGLGEIGRDLRARWPNIDFELLDLRDEHHVEKDGIYVETVKLPGDPRGGVTVDLGKDSAFAPLDAQRPRYYGAYYDWAETNRHHREGRHEYRVSRSPLEADVFISIPKLKTHKKCGLTVNLKALVGINANKNWLPHYVFGAPAEGGDQFATASLKTRLENAIVRPAKQMLIRGVPAFKDFARRTKRIGYEFFGDTEQVVRSGNWHGNDTVWRMSLDLNRILLYGTPEGALRENGSAKRYFSVVDGIVAMEGNGPVAGDRRPLGILIAGANPVAVDTVAARLMGLDPDRLPIVRHAWLPHRQPLIEGAERDLEPVSNEARWNRPLAEWRPEESLRFRPHFGWTGAIEWRE
ncbi:MAG TPA: DUF362 domain-containing protein [Candidatus Udaeobacter sp.]|jgi:uncharacterized protein (DUF362 family)|nr:DUF362 domain-containing protein [Candidatus Udaeobacter sp.]